MTDPLFKIVTIKLAVPMGNDDYMDALSNMRDDAPEALRQWWSTGVRENLTAEQVAAAQEFDAPAPPRWISDSVINVVFNTQTLHRSLGVLMQPVVTGAIRADGPAVPKVPFGMNHVIRDAFAELGRCEDGIPRCLPPGWADQLADALWQHALVMRDQFTEVSIQEKPVKQVLKGRCSTTIDYDALCRLHLGSARVEGNTLKLTCGDLPKDVYDALMKVIAGLGGRWSVAKRVHVFERDVEKLIAEYLETGKRRNLKKEFQAFYTPRDIAVMAAQKLDPRDGDIVMDPSCGHGALLRAACDQGANIITRGFDVDPMAIKRCHADGFTDVRVADFLKEEPGAVKPNKIIMNPPFAKWADIIHVTAAYQEHLAPGGRLVAIMSTTWREREVRICRGFRHLIDSVGHELYEINAGAFAESGTTIPTCMLVLNKPKEA